MCVQGEQESERERVEHVWEERGSEEERRGVGFGGRGRGARRLAAPLTRSGRTAGEQDRIYAGKSQEIERAERVNVQQDRQREDKVGYVGNRPIPEKPDVPVLALDMRVYRGEQASVAPPRTARIV